MLLQILFYGQSASGGRLHPQPHRRRLPTQPRAARLPCPLPSARAKGRLCPITPVRAPGGLAALAVHTVAVSAMLACVGLMVRQLLSQRLHAVVLAWIVSTAWRVCILDVVCCIGGHISWRLVSIRSAQPRRPEAGWCRTASEHAIISVVQFFQSCRDSPHLRSAAVRITP
jgi:hypothetical protein